MAACGFQLSADVLRNNSRQNDKRTLDRRLEILLPRSELKSPQEVDRYRSANQGVLSRSEATAVSEEKSGEDK